MPPRSRAGGSYSSISNALRSSNNPPYSLSSNPKESYRDLLIFEERLKQNSARLASQRKKYEVFLLSLILTTILLLYSVFVLPSQYTLVHFVNVGLLLIAIVTLILFFATGVYSEKIAYAYKFVPQANRALRYFNIYLNTKKPPRSWSLNPVRWVKKTPADTPVSPISRAASVTRVSSMGKISSANGSTNSLRSRSPLSGSRAIPLAPIPPSLNPRGEIIFSSKVSDNFKDGYEKYRSDWEKRRKPLHHELGWWVWLKSFAVKPPKSSAQSQPAHKKVAPATGERGVGKVLTLSHPDNPPSQLDEQSDSSTTSAFLEGAAARRNTPARGRNSAQRPLIRTSSSSSIASTNTSLSHSQSRRSSPFRQHDHSSSQFPSYSRSSSNPSTPDLIREEEDEEYFTHQRRNYSSYQSSSSTSPGSASAYVQHPADNSRSSEEGPATAFIHTYHLDVDEELKKDRLRENQKEESVGFGAKRYRVNSFNEFLEELREDSVTGSKAQ